MKKVFCKECFYLKKNFYTEQKDCYYPNNLKYIEDYYTSKRIPKKLPSTINKNTDCKWYKKR